MLNIYHDAGKDTDQIGRKILKLEEDKWTF